MRSLYESLLDDEEDMINNTSAAKEVKLKIIDFIKDNYALYNLHWSRLKIERYIKINKDLTVDIKTNTPTSLQVLHDADEIMPVKNFKWGKIWNLLLYCDGHQYLKNLPISCNYLLINDALNLKSLEGLPLHINTLDINKPYLLTNLKSIGNIEPVENINIRLALNLKSLEGLPLVKTTLTIYNCPKLTTLISLNNLQKITCSYCPLITSDELNKTNAKIKYNI